MAGKQAGDFREGILVGVSGSWARESSAMLRLMAELQSEVPADVQKNRTEEPGFVPVGSLVPRALGARRAVEYAAELRLRDRQSDARRARVVEVMQILMLDRVEHLRVSRLSVAHQLLLNVAVELLNSPAMVWVELVDEMLVDDQKEIVFEGLREVCKHEGIHVICMLEAMETDIFDAHCDVVYQLVDGQLADGKFVKQSKV